MDLKQKVLKACYPIIMWLSNLHQVREGHS